MNKALAQELVKPEYDGLTDEEIVTALADVFTTTETHQVGSGQARGFFIFNGIWTTLKTIAANNEHPLQALCEGVLITASDASSFFGMNPDKAEGIANRDGLQVLVDAGVMTAEQGDAFVAMTKTKDYPFRTVQVEDIQAARTIGESDCAITYDGTAKGTAKSEIPHWVAHGNTVFKFEIVADAPLPKDCVVTLSYSEKNGGETEFSKVDRVFRQAIKAGETRVVSRNYSTNNMNQHIDFSATIDCAGVNVTVNVTGK